MTFVKLPVVPLYWHFPRTIKGYSSQVEFWSRAQFNMHTHVINVNSLHTLPGWFINYITSTLL